MYSSRRRVNLALVHSLLTILLSRVLGKPTVMMPQSIGPLSKRFDRWLTRLALRGVEPVVARDHTAVAEAEAVLAGLSNTVELCPDIAFHGWQSIRQNAKTNPREGDAIGVVVMDWTWARQVDSQLALDNYVSKITEVIVILIRAGIKVNLLGHSSLPEHQQDDYVVAKRIATAVQESGEAPPSIVDLDADPERISHFFATMSTVVGTRLHSCILSMVSGTPAIALAYQPKSLGTYELLQLGDLCFDVEHFTSEQLITAILNVIAEGSELSEKVGEAVDRARLTITAALRLTTGRLDLVGDAMNPRPAETQGTRDPDRAVRNLGSFTGHGYDKGRSLFWQAAWFATMNLCFSRWWCPLAWRPLILKAFGAEVGDGVVIRHRVRILWPWKLAIGEHSWIGEGVWLLNLEDIVIGANACLSQEVFLCTGSHDRRSSTFEYANGPINIGDEVWLATQVLVLRGVTIGRGAVVSARVVVAKNIPEQGLVRKEGGS